MSFEESVARVKQFMENYMQELRHDVIGKLDYIEENRERMKESECSIERIYDLLRAEATVREVGVKNASLRDLDLTQILAIEIERVVEKE